MAALGLRCCMWAFSSCGELVGLVFQRPLPAALQPTTDTKEFCVNLILSSCSLWRILYVTLVPLTKFLLHYSPYYFLMTWSCHISAGCISVIESTEMYIIIILECSVMRFVGTNWVSCSTLKMSYNLGKSLINVCGQRDLIETTAINSLLSLLLEESNDRILPKYWIKYNRLRRPPQ